MDFLSVQITSCTAWTSRKWLVVQVQISATVPQFSHPTKHSTYVQSNFTTESQQPLLNFNGSFISVHQKLNNSSLLMSFNMVENKLSILNWIQCKPLPLPSCTSQQTEALGTMNNLGQVPCQDHTVCMRYLGRGIIFQKSNHQSLYPVLIYLKSIPNSHHKVVSSPVQWNSYFHRSSN